jgi:hypothetical protein
MTHAIRATHPIIAINRTTFETSLIDPGIEKRQAFSAIHQRRPVGMNSERF